MATQTFTATYSFEYRFKCEHCGQISQWETACFREQTEYKDSVFKSEESRLFAENEFDKEFEKKVPQLQQEVEDGKYNAVYSDFTGQCPNCKKRQSWGKVETLSSMADDGIYGFFIALLTMYGWSSVFDTSIDVLLKICLVMLSILGTAVCIYFFYQVIKVIILRFRLAIKYDSKNANVQNKPEFRWPNIHR